MLLANKAQCALQFDLRPRDDVSAVVNEVSSGAAGAQGDDGKPADTVSKLYAQCFVAFYALLF